MKDGLPATTETTETPSETHEFSNPNELETVLTPEQEQDFVEQILKDGDFTPKSVEPEKEPETEKQPEDEKQPEVTKDPVVVEEEKEVEKPSETTLTEPQTDDLWIEVDRVVVDDLGEETTETVKLVYDPADPSSFIPDDFTAKSTKQLAEIMEAKAEMAKLYESRQDEFNKVAEAKAAADKDKELLAGWDEEIADLVRVGALEEPKLKPGEEGYDKDPAVVKTDAVFNYMAEQNAERAKTGLPPIRSFGLAYTMYEGAEAKRAEEEAEKKEAEDTKAKGALIGGGSAASGGTAEQAAYKSGSHHSIWDVPVAD